MIKLATVAAVGVVGAGMMTAPVAPAQAHVFCGPLLPLCVAGAVVGAATVATVATAATAPYYASPPTYYPAAPAYYAPSAYYGPAYYPAPAVRYGYGPYWHARYWGRPYHRRWHPY